MGEYFHGSVVNSLDTFTNVVDPPRYFILFYVTFPIHHTLCQCVYWCGGEGFRECHIVPVCVGGVPSYCHLFVSGIDIWGRGPFVGTWIRDPGGVTVRSMVSVSEARVETPCSEVRVGHNSVGSVVVRGSSGSTCVWPWTLGSGIRLELCSVQGHRVPRSGRRHLGLKSGRGYWVQVWSGVSESEVCMRPQSDRGHLGFVFVWGCVSTGRGWVRVQDGGTFQLGVHGSRSELGYLVLWSGWTCPNSSSGPGRLGMCSGRYHLDPWSGILFRSDGFLRSGFRLVPKVDDWVVLGDRFDWPFQSKGRFGSDISDFLHGWKSLHVYGCVLMFLVLISFFILWWVPCLISWSSTGIFISRYFADY